MNAITEYVLQQLDLAREDIQDKEITRKKQIKAAQNFQKVYRKIDPRTHVLKTNIFRYVQRYSATREQLQDIQNIIIYATQNMYTAKGEEDYRKILKHFEKNYPLS